MYKSPAKKVRVAKSLLIIGPADSADANSSLLFKESMHALVLVVFCVTIVCHDTPVSSQSLAARSPSSSLNCYYPVNFAAAVNASHDAITWLTKAVNSTLV